MRLHRFEGENGENCNPRNRENNAAHRSGDTRQACPSGAEELLADGASLKPSFIDFVDLKIRYFAGERPLEIPTLVKKRSEFANLSAVDSVRSNS
jgi:hypothetical protein